MHLLVAHLRPAAFRSKSCSGRLGPLPLLSLPIILLVFSQLAARADSFTSGCQASGDGGVTPITAPGRSASYFMSASSSCSGSATASATDSLSGPEEGQVANFFQSASGNGGGVVSPGDIGVNFTASASSSPQSYTFLDSQGTPVTVNNNERAGFEGFTAAQWTDFFTVNGASGTIITLQFTLSFDGSFQTSGVASTSGGDVLDWLNGGLPGSPPILVASLSGPGTQTATLTAAAGYTFEILNSVVVQANACAGGPGQCSGDYVSESLGAINATDTGALFVTDLTPGTSFTTASGFDYAAPSTVPEPGTLLLFGTGLMAMTAIPRRHWRR